MIIQNNWRKSLYVNSTQCIMQNSKLLATIVKLPEIWNKVSSVANGLSKVKIYDKTNSDSKTWIQNAELLSVKKINANQKWLQCKDCTLST